MLLMFVFTEFLYAINHP